MTALTPGQQLWHDLLAFDETDQWLQEAQHNREHALLFVLRATNIEARVSMGSVKVSKHIGRGLGREFNLFFYAVVLEGEMRDASGHVGQKEIEQFHRDRALADGLKIESRPRWRDLHEELAPDPASNTLATSPETMRAVVARGIAFAQAQQLAQAAPVPEGQTPRPRL